MSGAEYDRLAKLAPGNRVAHLASRIERAWNAGLIDDVRSCLDDVFSISSNRTVAAAGNSEGAAAVIQVLSIHEFFSNCQFNAIADRGDDLLLLRWNLWSDSGYEMEMLVVSQVSDSGLLERAATFDPDAAEGAIAMLDRWAAESYGTA